MTLSRFPTLTVPALAAALVAGTLGAAVAQVDSPPTLLAISTLGDLTPFRTIASDTLAIVDQGDIPAARARIKTLETSWDQAEPTLKSNDKPTWTAVDGMIDAVLSDLRSPAPKPATCAASLRALIAELDGLADS